MSNTNFPNVFPSTDPEAEAQDFTQAVSFLDGSLSVKNTAAPTKVLQLSAAGITAGQTRILTAPDYAGTIATLAGTETLSNKTMSVVSSKCSANVGAAATGVTAVEYGDGFNHVTVLTVSTTLPAIAGGAALAIGKLLYTLPAGAQIIRASYMSLGVTQTQGNINADVPKVGLGSVIGVGAVAVLNGNAAFMDLITEQAAANCTGTATVKTAVPTTTPFVFISAAGGVKTIHANFAATWAASGDAAALLAGYFSLANTSLIGVKYGYKIIWNYNWRR